MKLALCAGELDFLFLKNSCLLCFVRSSISLLTMRAVSNTPGLVLNARDLAKKEERADLDGQQGG
jgi:hypothetical protein